MLSNRDYRHNKDYSPHDEHERQLKHRRAGSTPTARKVERAGFCESGYALFYVNGSEVASHVPTPADTPEIAEHKKICP